MKKSARKTVVEQYGQLQPTCVAFASKLRELIVSLLQAHDVKFQVVEARAKDVSSFEEKLSRPGKRYEDPLKQVPDLVGCRVIVYYLDDVQKVSDIVRNEFEVLEEESSHQPEAFDADRFGYLSMHYVVRLSKNRIKLTEWKPFSEQHLEIQIRTVIQHAWSAVSHALQYKKETTKKGLLSRRLFRIAGLFELADEEFANIRDQKNRMTEIAVDALAHGKEDLPLTPTGVEQFIKQWPKLGSLTELASNSGFNVVPGINPDDPYLGHIVDFSQKVGITDIGELKRALEQANTNVFDQLMRDEEKDAWAATEDFLIYILLIAAFKDKAELANEGDAWDDEVFESLKVALDRL